MQPNMKKLYICLKSGSIKSFLQHPRRFSSLISNRLQKSAKKSNGFLQRITECNTATRESTENLTPFFVGNKKVGFIHPKTYEQLHQFKEIFDFEAGQKISLRKCFSSLESRTKAISLVVKELSSMKFIRGWRDEFYEVKDYFQSDPLFLIERAAAPYFGIMTWGVHINGYTENKFGEKQIWVAKRSGTKPNYPGKLDNIVAGGHPFGLTAFENVVKECREEANIPTCIAQNAVAVSSVSFSMLKTIGVDRGNLLCYDLKLPSEFTPSVNDGEVESFTLYPLQEVADLISMTTEFKPNCNLVIIDFLIRHGYITPDSHPGYEDIVLQLRSPNSP